MSEPQKKTGLGFWAIVVMSSLMLYALSAGPAELLMMKMGAPQWLVVPGNVFYAPLAWSLEHCPDLVSEWYVADYCGWWRKLLGAP